MTPIYLNLESSGIDWLRYLEIYQSLSPPERHVAELVGVEERGIVRCLSGVTTGVRGLSTRRRSGNRSANLPQLRRFYLALALHRLVREDPLAVVAERFAINRGLLQSLMQQASTYAGYIVLCLSMLSICAVGFGLLVFFFKISKCCLITATHSIQSLLF